LAHPTGLQELAEGLGITAQVRFVPPVPRAQLADWYRAADLVAVPSHSESFGLVAVEAQACGTPVVAADVGGLPTAIGDAGILVDGHDPHVWSLALESLLLEPEQREKLGRKAVEHAALFGWDRTTERLYEVYVEACRARADSKDAPSPIGSLAAGVPAAVTP
jgi:D-inositol-3-phosphate glycosyltransferase